MLSGKEIRHWIFGAYFIEDMCDKFGPAYPGLARRLYWSVLPEMAAKGLIFIHVPRAGGTSVAQALFNGRSPGHHSIRAYRSLEPALYRTAQSFAVMRDPMDRFRSSYAFVRQGGGDVVPLTRIFREQTAHIRSVDDYLDFVEDRQAFDLDFVMRAQSWFICDLVTKAPLVKRIFLLGRDDAELDAFLIRHGAPGPLPRVNEAKRPDILLTRAQRDRIERLYADDFDLYDDLLARRERRLRRPAAGASVM